MRSQYKLGVFISQEVVKGKWYMLNNNFYFKQLPDKIQLIFNIIQLKEIFLLINIFKSQLNFAKKKRKKTRLSRTSHKNFEE